MGKTIDGSDITAQDLLDALQADLFAEEHDDIFMDMAELDPEVWPPDQRYVRADHEAWVYNHGNIAELVFVKT